MLACAVDPHTAGVAVVDAYNGQDQTNRRDVIQVDPRTVKHACIFLMTLVEAPYAYARTRLDHSAFPLNRTCVFTRRISAMEEYTAGKHRSELE